MIISLIIPLHKIVTKANMATDVDGNILEMSFLFTMYTGHRKKVFENRKKDEKVE